MKFYSNYIDGNRSPIDRADFANFVASKERDESLQAALMMGDTMDQARIDHLLSGLYQPESPEGEGDPGEIKPVARTLFRFTTTTSTRPVTTNTLTTRPAIPPQTSQHHRGLHTGGTDNRDSLELEEIITADTDKLEQSLSPLIS